MGAFLLAFLKSAMSGLTEPVVSEIRNQLHRILIATCLAAAGVGCVIVGLTYFASALWHVLVPAIGMPGADLVMGLVYGILAIGLIASGSRMIR